jgi:hypothetical protein
MTCTGVVAAVMGVPRDGNRVRFFGGVYYARHTRLSRRNQDRKWDNDPVVGLAGV